VQLGAPGLFFEGLRAEQKRTQARPPDRLQDRVIFPPVSSAPFIVSGEGAGFGKRSV
jgi:hypothetical protein